MELRTVTTDLEERELKRLGGRVAQVLERDAGRALHSARARLFQGERTEERSWFGARWVVGLAAVGAVAAIAFSLQSDAPKTRVQAGGAVETQPETSVDEGSRTRVDTRPDGALELVLESGEVRGIVGPQSTGPRTIVAGPYRVTGDAEVVVSWIEGERLVVEVSRGEARVLYPDHPTVVIPAGSMRMLPATR